MLQSHNFPSVVVFYGPITRFLDIISHMLKEYHQPTADESLVKAIHSLNPEKRIPYSFNGHRVTLGLPDLKLKDNRKIIVIPSTPYIFTTRIITFLTQKDNYKHLFTLNNQVIILGHGSPKRRNPLGWEFTDGQNPLQMVADFNSQNNGFPKINVIVCCRPIIPTLHVGAQFKKNGIIYHKNKLIPNAQFPEGWPSVPNIIIPKCGDVKFIGVIEDSGVDSLIISEVSDFYKISKKGRPINLRKRPH